MAVASPTAGRTLLTPADHTLLLVDYQPQSVFAVKWADAAEPAELQSRAKEPSMTSPVTAMQTQTTERPGKQLGAWRDHYSPNALLSMLTEADALVEKDGRAARACLRQALMLVGEQLQPTGELVPSTRRQLLAPWQIRKLVAHIDSHLDQTIRIADLAALVCLTAGYFSKAFRESFDVSPHAFVMQRRMAAAQRMLLETNEALAQIALACGLCDQAHFSRAFRRTYGASPARWRRSRRGPGPA